jgi:hypothetical protein
LGNLDEDGSELTQERGHWQAIQNTVKHLPVPYNVGHSVRKSV